MVKISFIVTAYNLEDYITRCLTSLINQTYKDIEVIIVDDGSKDKTVEKVNEICKMDPRCLLVKKTNGGANSARKTGLELVNGEFVVFVDGDDYIDCKLAERIAEEVNKKKCDIISFNYASVDDEGNRRDKIDNIKCDLQEYEYLELLLRQEVTHSLNNKAYNREFLIMSNFTSVCNLSIGEDMAANIAIATSKPKVSVLKEVFYFYYQRENSSMRTSGELQLQIIDSLKYIEEVLSSKSLKQKYLEEIEFLWFVHVFYMRVVAVRVCNRKEQKQLFLKWKEKNVYIDKNTLCKEFIKKLNLLRRITIRIFNKNYFIGYIIQKLELYIRKILRSR
ncbi:spore coat polysaccharide biosynthesis protein [Clostridium paraputrificum]|uniref:glycosyltransferase family 2 protein n=1 Tax=Clostridium paraputrificum TaxID=29363 RepID=UPI0006C437F1|nr:glycosyltransferase family 2 protein [Clostridium paraputrificum]CUQ42734.1 spore coat polysaccharide biosynthesis protein [Clostridium paraputrificum]